MCRICLVPAVLLVAGCGADSSQFEEQYESIAAYRAMEEFVKRQLDKPESAKFPHVYEREDVGHAMQLDGHTFYIVSYVDAENDFGESVRMLFSGRVQKTAEDEWKLLDLEMEPREQAAQ